MYFRGKSEIIMRRDETKLREKALKADYALLLAVAVLLAIGIISVFSAQHRASVFSFGPSSSAYRHLLNIGIGLFAMIIAFCLPLKKLDNTVLILFFSFAVIILLFAVILFGSNINGAHRWLKIGFLNFQPSELAKIVLIFYVSHYIRRKNSTVKEKNPKWSWGLLIIIGGIIALVAIEPDVSTALVLLLLIFVFFFVGNVPLKFSLVLIMCVLSIGLMLYLLPGSRFKHIDERIKNYAISIRRGETAVPENSQMQNSILAFANGGLFGRGLCKGELKNGSFIPEVDRDLIIAAVGEEMGFVGTLFLMSLYFVILVLGFKIALFFEDKDRFLFFLAFGISANFFVFAIIHAFISIGYLPATGLVLPFVSYGGTSMVGNLFMLGILLNISAESKIRQMNENIIKKREMIFLSTKSKLNSRGYYIRSAGQKTGNSS